MRTDATLGPAFPELGWVPAPRYLMRRARVLDLARGITPGALLEIGPGAGTLLMEFSDLGFNCQALESSQEARALADRLFSASGKAIPLWESPGEDWRQRFDTLFAFDVLEHIEHDGEALSQWREWIKPGGHMLLSVPAHMRLWTAGDEWAGHFRRYERSQLRELVQVAGFEIEAFECYGFPLTNFTERVSASIYRKLIRRGEGSAEDDRRSNNARSGVDRSPHLRAYPVLASLPGKFAMRGFFALQNAFLKRDLGSGYILRARRR